MNLRDKFDTGKETCTYRRIDAEYKTDIFVGYNERHQMSMVIAENGSEGIVKATNLINVFLKRREDGKMALSFDLQDNRYNSVFLVFCRDMILTCEKNGKDNAISSALLRWKYWKSVFGAKRSSLLDESKIKGLIGELLMLRNYFVSDCNEEKAVNSWLGPLAGHKDFELDDTWYEVKTIGENSTEITINSLEQLESDVDGHLLVVRLEKTSSTNSSRVSLNMLIFEIMDSIQDADVLNLFQHRLDSAGYYYDEAYDQYNYLFKGYDQYKVGVDFPRIRRNQISEYIGNAKYTIILACLTQYKEK